ncbi:bifunctional hydroxymethylpyrimidine kinase/phosphomethylpyrimidine kinase, partial [Staphylococcus cohnii]|uniref:bifunctional hydroxymethylpyrimidine kinase/phosphomethylpyrimidine kinase n=1 Tax=Staphylococcus cohnii TaxID=29382 RepID=UPI0034DB2D17
MPHFKSFHPSPLYPIPPITTILPQNTKPLHHIHNLHSTSLQHQMQTIFSHQLPHPFKTPIIASNQIIHIIQTYLKK